MDGPDYIWNRELVLVTGKGGVGKTTVTAGLARAAQRAGRRVLVGEVTSEVGTTSTLLGLFGVPSPKGESPVRLDEGLDGVRITPSAGHRLFLRAALRVGMIADAAMRSAALNRFLLAAPAFPEIGTLYQLVSLLREQRWDHMILDLPATGHALGLASLPRTVLRVVPVGLIGEAIKEGLDAMTNPARGGAVVVTLPEDLPVTESLELVEGLGRLEVPVRGMVLNQMPDTAFAPPELAAVDAHLAGRAAGGPLLLGAREFRRLQRSLAAQTRFWRESPDSLVRMEIERLEERAALEIVEHMANHFLAHPAGDRPAEGAA